MQRDWREERTEGRELLTIQLKEYEKKWERVVSCVIREEGGQVKKGCWLCNWRGEWTSVRTSGRHFINCVIGQEKGQAGEGSRLCNWRGEMTGVRTSGRGLLTG